MLSATTMKAFRIAGLLFLSTLIALSAKACSKESPRQTLERYWNDLEKNEPIKANRHWLDPTPSNALADWHFAPPDDTLAAHYAAFDRIIEETEISDKKARVKVTLIDSSNERISLTYHLADSKGWKLIDPPDYYCDEWVISVVDGLILKAPSGKMPGADFYEPLRTMFAHTKSMLEVKDDTPITIYLAESPAEVEKLSGSRFQRRMWFYPAESVLIFAYQNRSMPSNLPLLQARQVAVGLVPILAYRRYGHDSYEVPLIKYGLAVYFWGADGHTPEVVRLLAAQSGRLDSLPEFPLLFDPELFRSDASFYSVVGSLVVDFLIKNYGWNKFNELYSASERLESFSRELFSDSEIEALRKGWRSYLTDFLESAKKQDYKIKEFALSNRYRRR